MKAGTSYLTIGDFTGGEAFIYPLTAMPAKCSLLMQNCFVSERGSLCRVPGYVRINSNQLSNPIVSGFHFLKKDGTSQYLVASGGKLYKLYQGEFVEIYSGLSTSSKVRFSNFGDNCIITDGVNTPLKYDGSNFTQLTDYSGTCFKSHVHKGRLWFIDSADTMIAYHSELMSPAKEGYIDFKYVLAEGDELVGMTTFVDLLVFFFKNHIAIYAGQTPSGVNSDFELVHLIKGTGLYATDGVQNYGTDCLFLSRHGVKTLRQIVNTGSLNIQNISTLIDPQLTKVLSEGGSVASGHYPKLGWILFKIGSTIYCFNYHYRSWHRLIGADCNDMFNDSAGNLYFCGNGFLYQYGSGWKFGDTVPLMRWDSAWIPIGQVKPSSPKVMDVIAFSDRETLANIIYSYDMHEPEIVIEYAFKGIIINEVTDWDAIPAIEVYQSPEPTKVPLFGRGRYIRFSFRHEDDAAFELSSIGIQLTTGGL